MATTANRNYPLPEAGSSVKDEIERLQQATLPMLDGDVQALFDAISGLSEIGHKHPISDVEGLSAALAAKMPASKTFSIGELSGVVGADDAPDGYVLVKVGEEWVAQAALSALGPHNHVIADVSGLGDALDTLTEAASGAQATADEAKGAAVPIGIVFMQNGPVDPGYLRFGEGGSYDRASYPDLAAWMDANGQTAFGLTPTQIANGEFPDWRDYSVRTAGGMLGPAVGVKQEDAMQRITGTLTRMWTNGYPTGAIRGTAGANTKPATGTNGEIDMTFDSGNSPGARVSDQETRVKAVGIRWQIKAYGAFVGGGTADLVAIQQDVQTVKNGAVRKDVDLSGSYGVPEKVTILKNTMQAWEVVPGGAIAPLLSPAAYLEWAGTLGDYAMLRLQGVFVPTVDDTTLNCQMGTGGLDTSANYGYQNISAQQTALNASSANGSRFPISAASRTTNTGMHGSVDVTLARFNKPVAARIVSTSGAYTSAANLSVSTGWHSLTTARDTLKLLASSGNIGIGSSFILEGMRG